MFSSILLASLCTNTATATEFVPTPVPYVLLQSWVTLYDQDENTLADPGSYGDPEDDMGFKMRRARVGFTGENELFKYSMIVGMSSHYDMMFPNPSGVQIVDANIGMKPLLNQPLWVTVGVQKVPVSREQIMSSADLVLAERAVSSVWMVPNRDAGAVAKYKLGKKDSKAIVQAGVFNGNQSMLGDDNNGKMLVGRVDFVSGAANTFKTYGKVDKLTIGLGGDIVVDKGIATDRMILGGDTMIRFDGLAILAEFRNATISPIDDALADPAVFATTKQMGYLAQVGYTYKSYEGAVRYSSFDDNSDLTNAGDLSSVRVGMTWHAPKDVIRIGGGYEMRIENGSDDIANDSAVMWFQFQQ